MSSEPADARETRPGVVTREVRVLEGPNLYFPRPAVKVTLALPGYLDAPVDTLRAVSTAAGLRRGQPGAPGSEQRQQVLLRVVERVARALATEVGTRRLGVRTRAANETDVVVCAFVWRHRARAEALGAAIGLVLADLLAGRPFPDAVADRAATVAAASPLGDGPRLVTPRIPVASVTGTNGKTTTTRLLAHICMTAGLSTGWSSTDGVVVQGEVVEPGDYSGPAGARAVLETPGVEIGILETARGGMLLRGMGVTHNDVSVVTNVSADHLGMQGIDTVDQLAEVKAIVTRVTKPQGWVVLNGEDPRVWAMRAGIRARPWVFTADASAPAVRESLGAGGRAMTVLDGHLTVLRPDAAPDRLVRVLDLPMALSGLSHHNVLNALAGAAAALGLGLDRAAVVEGLRTFAPDDVLNPGRMNTYTVPVEGGDVTVVIDLAHNEAGLEALLDVSRGLVAPGGRVHLALGTAGDRTDDILRALGEIAGLRADHVVAAHKAQYLRGRTPEELEGQLRVGLAHAGVGDIASYPTELAGLQALLEAADEGDVVAVMCHAERVEIVAWLHEQGATSDDPGRHPPQGRARPRRARVRGRDRRPVGAAGCRGAGRGRGGAVRGAPGRRPDRVRVRRGPRQRRRRGRRRAALRGGAGRRAARAAPAPRPGAARLEPAQPGSARRGRGRHRRRRGPPPRQPRGRGLPCPGAPRRGCLHPGAVRAGGGGRATSTDPDVARYRRALAAYAADLHD